jgi:hypothetical protein
MANYAVFLEGANFVLTRGIGKELLGFFVTVRVESSSAQEAASGAISLVKSDPQLEEAFRAVSEKTPTVVVKVVHELLPENRMKNTEFMFFPMEEQ